MNKLYALIILFLAQSACAMEEEQKVVVDPKYFNTNVASGLNRSGFQQHMVDWMKEHGKVHLSWSDDDAENKDRSIQYAIAESAQAYHNTLRSIKLMAAHALSAGYIEPMLQRLASKIPIVQKMPIEARAIGMPAASFVVGFLLECSELSQGHALLNPNMQRKLYSKELSQEDEMLSRSLSVATKDFKVAAAVSALKTVGDLAMQASGGYGTLDSIKESLQERLPLFKSHSANLYSTCRFMARQLVYAKVREALYGPDRDYVKYLDQPDFESRRFEHRKNMFR